MAKLQLSLALLVLCRAVSGFGPGRARMNRVTTTKATTKLQLSTTPPPPYVEPLMDMPSTAPAKHALLSVCERLKSQNGVLIVDPTARAELLEAVDDLVQQSEPPMGLADESCRRNFIGDWTLLCSTTIVSKTMTNNNDESSSAIDFFTKLQLPKPLQQLRSRVSNLANRYLKVQQRIRTDGNSIINRVDHVIEYEPPQVLQDILDTAGAAGPSVPNAIAGLNLNPLGVSKSKLILVHTATVSPDLTTKLSLQSIVLNVAGTSTSLDPNGKDVAALNLPTSLLSDWMSSSNDSFDTSYMDDSLRISRGKLAGGLVEQLRVFVKQTSKGDESLRQTDIDVDESVDPEFVYESELQDEDPKTADDNDSHEGQDDVSPSDY